MSNHSSREISVEGLVESTSCSERAAVNCLQRMRPALGTLCTIEACGSSELLESAIDRAFGELRRVEQLMHPTKVGSDLARLATMTGRTVTIDAHTWNVLSLSRRFYELSSGCFDPCLPGSSGCFEDVDLLDDNQVCCQRDVAIDLGGIAKGYAIDLAVNALRESGCEAGLVNAGGDMRAFGNREQQILIALGSCKNRKLVLNERALAVSDAAAVNRPPEFKGYYSRRFGQARIFNQAAVLAEQAAVADALTKCALLCNEISLTQLLHEFQAELVWLQ